MEELWWSRISRSLEDHGEVPEEMSPLPVDGVLEARVVGVQVRAVHQHLLAVVQVTDHLQGGHYEGVRLWSGGTASPKAESRSHLINLC